MRKKKKMKPFEFVAFSHVVAKRSLTNTRTITGAEMKRITRLDDVPF